jgi:hypothetical protein
MLERKGWQRQVKGEMARANALPVPTGHESAYYASRAALRSCARLVGMGIGMRLFKTPTCKKKQKEGEVW